jgi:hypothetical protein
MAAPAAEPAGGTMAAPASTTAPTGTAMPTTPYQVPGAGTNPNPTTAAAPKAKGGRVAGQQSQSASAVRRRNARANAKATSATGNKVMGQMANTLQQQNASKDNRGNALAEALAHRIEIHKQKMFETGLARGSISVFKK